MNAAIMALALTIGGVLIPGGYGHKNPGSDTRGLCDPGTAGGLRLAAAAEQRFRCGDDLLGSAAWRDWRQHGAGVAALDVLSRGAPGESADRLRERTDAVCPDGSWGGCGSVSVGLAHFGFVKPGSGRGSRRAGSGPSSSSLSSASGSGRQLRRRRSDSVHLRLLLHTAGEAVPANRTLPNAATASSVKPYSSYTRPSAVSPYMELDRRTDSYGTIDNYNQYVRPRLEQANANRQMGSEIRGLQHSVQNLGRATTSVRGIAIPQYDMNYEAYYPGFQR